MTSRYPNNENGAEPRAFRETLQFYLIDCKTPLGKFIDIFIIFLNLVICAIFVMENYLCPRPRGVCFGIPRSSSSCFSLSSILQDFTLPKTDSDSWSRLQHRRSDRHCADDLSACASFVRRDSQLRIYKGDPGAPGVQDIQVPPVHRRSSVLLREYHPAVVEFNPALFDHTHDIFHIFRLVLLC